LTTAQLTITLDVSYGAAPPIARRDIRRILSAIADIQGDGELRGRQTPHFPIEEDPNGSER
jgi:hypothetical protein